MMAQSDWATEIREIRSAVERVEQAVSDLSRWIWDNVVAKDVLPRHLPRPVDSQVTALAREIQTIRDLAAEAFDRYSSRPSGKVLAGVPLTREEYYLCRAMGVDLGTAPEIGLAPFGDYEVYCMLCYEDEAWRGYINVHLNPREASPTCVGARFGRPPEECRRRFLRPEQDAFFREHLPPVHQRFADG